MATIRGALQTLQTLATMASTHNPGMSRYLWAAAVLVAGFATAALGGKVLAIIMRAALVVVAVLVAARVVGVTI